MFSLASPQEESQLPEHERKFILSRFLKKSDVCVRLWWLANRLFTIRGANQDPQNILFPSVNMVVKKKSREENQVEDVLGCCVFAR